MPPRLLRKTPYSLPPRLADGCIRIRARQRQDLVLTWHYAALDDGRVQIAVAIVALVALGVAAVLFVQQWKSGFVIDKRNYMDMTRFQWRKRIAQDRDESDRRGGHG